MRYKGKKLKGGGNITNMLNETFNQVAFGEISQRDAVETVIGVLDLKDMDIKDLDGRGANEDTGCGVKAIGEGGYGKVLKFCLNVDKTGMDWNCTQCSVIKITKPPTYDAVKDYARKNHVSEGSAELQLINEDFEMLEEEYFITQVISENIDLRFKDHSVKCQRNDVPNSGFLILEELRPVYKNINTLDNLLNLTLGWIEIPGVPILKPQEFHAIICQILGTLGFIRRIIPDFQHNDLHCDNIMITSYETDPPADPTFPNFGRYCAKIIDYGMATSSMPNLSTTAGRNTWNDWLRNPNQDPLRLFSSIYNQIKWAIDKMPQPKRNAIPQYLVKFCQDIESSYNVANPQNQPKMSDDFYAGGGFYGFPQKFTTSKQYYLENISNRDPETIYKGLKDKFIKDYVERPPLAPQYMGPRGTGV